MRRVLVISYFYPPFSSVGGTRVSKLTRYLPSFGWEPMVLTTAHDDRPADMPLEIPERLVYRVNQRFDVLRGPRALLGSKQVEGRRFTTSGSPSRLLWRMGMLYRNIVCFPDPQMGWYGPAVAEGTRLTLELRPDAILSSSLPNTAHVVASAVSRRTGIPWIAEFRDLWTDNHNFRRIAPLCAVERILERTTLSRAAALVTVSEVWADTLRRRFGKPTYVVPNGFDPVDYPAMAPPESGPFELIYTGMFYDGKQNPAPLVQAIAAMRRDGVITPETFHLRLIGHYLSPVVGAAQAEGVEDFVHVGRPVSYRESLGVQRRATALLFFDWNDGREKGWYSAKIYEYLGARRPILSVGPHGTAVSALLDRTRAGLVGATAHEVRGILESWITTFRTAGSLQCSSDAATLAAYERRTAAGRMAEILEQHARH